MLYSDLAVPLLRGLRIRRRSWARGVVAFLRPGTAPASFRHDGEVKLRAMLSLALLTPAGVHKYESHSVDRRATDWEIADGHSEARRA